MKNKKHSFPKKLFIILLIIIILQLLNFNCFFGLLGQVYNMQPLFIYGGLIFGVFVVCYGLAKKETKIATMGAVMFAFAFFNTLAGCG